MIFFYPLSFFTRFNVAKVTEAYIFFSNSLFCFEFNTTIPEQEIDKIIIILLWRRPSLTGGGGSLLFFTSVRQSSNKSGKK